MPDAKVTNIADTVRGWVADKESAANISTTDLAAIQKQFRGMLTVVHMNDGGIAIYPSRVGCRKAFDEFMTKNGAFQERPIQLKKI